MIGIHDLAKAFGGRTLFEGVSLQLNAGSRYGLVGANGSGKTTFLKILARDEPATDGTVSIPGRARVGVLRQDRFLDDAAIIRDLAMMGDHAVWEALQRRARIIDHGEGDATALSDLEESIKNHDGYTLEARATAVLIGLGIPKEAHPRPLSTLSGGFKLRVLLAQVLVGGPDALFLDEPTNHLDILSIRWLEQFLAAYRGAALVISHDQRFLDNVATHILDVDYETITEYVGNYTSFEAQKVATRERKEAENARAEEAIAKKREFVERFGAKASKARQAQSRLKQIEKIDVEELKTSSRRDPLFRFTPERASGRDVLAVEGVSKSYGPKAVLKNVSLQVRRGEKVGVIGPNGLGKSTLLKIIMERLAADAGSVHFGHEVRPRVLPAGPQGAPDRPCDDAARLRVERPAPPRYVVRARAAGARLVLWGGRRQRRSDRSPAARPRACCSQDHRRQAERPGPRRADQPLGPRGHSRARRGPQGLRGHGAVRVARSLVRLRGRDAHPGGHARRFPRLPGDVRGVPRALRRRSPRRHGRGPEGEGRGPRGREEQGPGRRGRFVGRAEEAKKPPKRTSGAA